MNEMRFITFHKAFLTIARHERFTIGYNNAPLSLIKHFIHWREESIEICWNADIDDWKVFCCIEELELH